MLYFCSECGRYIEERRPLWDRSIYHDICEQCCKKDNDEDVSEEDRDESVS